MPAIDNRSGQWARATSQELEVVSCSVGPEVDVIITVLSHVDQSILRVVELVNGWRRKSTSSHRPDPIDVAK